MKRGKYIVIEGGEGCGKTTHATLLVDYLNNQHQASLYLREPGSIKVAEKIRVLLLDPSNEVTSLTELFLFEAARSEFIDKKVIPTLNSGRNVVSDRSEISTIVYQGYAGGLDVELIKRMNALATYGLSPNLAVVIDVPVKKGLEKEINPDRFAAKGESFHEKVNQGYRQVASEDPSIEIISYRDGKMEEMQEEIRERVRKIISF